MGGQRPSAARWVRVFLVVLAVVIFCCLGFAALVAADKHYVWFRGVLTGFLGTDNHFDGGQWFSVAATFIGGLISAVPGLMCGMLAYIQTERLHELEDRYHRPGLELDEARLSMIALRSKKGELLKDPGEIREGLPWTLYMYRRPVEEAIEKERPFYIVLKTEFHVKNEVTVKRIFIRQVDFLVGEEVSEWVLAGKKEKAEDGHHKIWEFNKQIQPGETKYTLEWILCPSEERATVGFWGAMRDFVLQEDIRDSRVRDLRLNVHMNVEYEYSARGGTECMLCVEYDVNKMQHAAVVQENCSCNGYFTYDTNKGKKNFQGRR